MTLPRDKRPPQTPLTRTEESGDVILASYPELGLKVGEAYIAKGISTATSVVKGKELGKFRFFGKLFGRNKTDSASESRQFKSKKRNFDDRRHK
jgi:hypothetical protein